MARSTTTTMTTTTTTTTSTTSTRAPSERNTKTEREDERETSSTAGGKPRAATAAGNMSDRRADVGIATGEEKIIMMLRAGRLCGGCAAASKMGAKGKYAAVAQGAARTLPLLLAATALAMVALHIELASARPHHHHYNQHFGPIPDGRQLPLGDYDRHSLAGYDRPRHLQRLPAVSHQRFGLDEDGHAADSWPQQQQGPQRRDDLEDELEDDDDGDQSAAASYQNQDGGERGQSVGGQDGFGESDPEPDAAYEETPNEQEGQADLERFFDDHLGASDREGMDKENLPSNLVHLLAEPASHLGDNQGSGSVSERPAESAHSSAPLMMATAAAPLRAVVNPVVERAPGAQFEPTLEPTIETTRYIKLPDKKNKLMITHQITRNKLPTGPLKDSHVREAARPAASSTADQGELYGWQREAPNDRSPKMTIETSGEPREQNNHEQAHQAASDVQLSEDDNFDRVFITNATNEPFKIAALGGFDPEQDFQDAAAEIDETTRAAGGAECRRRRATFRGRERERASADDGDADERDDELCDGRPQRGDNDNDKESGPTTTGDKWAMNSKVAADIQFNDEAPDSERLYEDASETDEVTFGQDDPYQTDLEAEMRQQDFDKVGQFLAASPQIAKRANIDDRQPGPNGLITRFAPSVQLGANNDRAASALHGEHRRRPSLAMAQRGRSRSRYDSDEGSWVDDGVEDMDIPSQSHQNMIMEKTAKREEAARRAAAAEADEPASDETPTPSASNGVAEGPPPAGRRSLVRDDGGKGDSNEFDYIGAEDAGSDDEDSRKGTQLSGSGQLRAGGRSAAAPVSTMADGDESDSSGGDGESIQRMPNANYLRDDLIEDDLSY